METKIAGGHTVAVEWDGVFVIDGSGWRVEVDTSKDIVASCGTFVVPLVSGYVTVGPAEEAFFIAERTGMKIKAGARRFQVSEA